MVGLVNSFRFGTGPTGSGYVTSVLADSPWGVWVQTETSGSTLADSSGNNRTMTIAAGGTEPNLNQTGPSSSTPAIQWPTSDNKYAATSAGFAHSTGTVECWIYLTALPTNVLNLLAAQDNGGGSYTKGLRVLTDGTVQFGITTTSFVSSAAAAFSLNAWHHIVGSIGAAGTKVRLDKNTIATAANTSSSGSSIIASIHRRIVSPGANSGGVLMAAPAIYATQLTDAQTDAHYDAMLAA